jgi:type I restriction enzyme M protein
MDQCNLHTIVKLPKGVFAPYTSIKTNILFFTKGVPTTDIWYFEHPYPDGYKSYSKTKPIRIEEFDLEKSWWNDREESELAWKVTAKSVKDNGYNLDIDNPNRVEDGHRSPDVLLAEYQKAEKLVDELREQLRTALAGSLE